MLSRLISFPRNAIIAFLNLARRTITYQSATEEPQTRKRFIDGSQKVKYIHKAIVNGGEQIVKVWFSGSLDHPGCP